MKISILENSKEVRQAFIDKFTMTKDEFREKRREWIEAVGAKNYSVIYEERYLWELMDYRAISFAESLELLRTLSDDVCFMSENAEKPGCSGIEFEGVEHKGCVAKMNANELADLIEFEWNEGWRISTLDMYFRQFIISKWSNEDNIGYEYWFDFDANTDYHTWDEAENAKVFNGLSLKEVSMLEGVRFDLISINGNKA